jgi:hypothetical protein
MRTDSEMAYQLNDIIDSDRGFLTFLKRRTELYHQSNVFRDFHYGVMAFAETKGKKISYGRGEELAKELIVTLEHAGILRSIKPGSWMLDYPEFRKPSSKSEAATKPGSGPAVAKTVIATPSSGLASPSAPGVSATSALPGV